jgi:acyl carrier protein
MPDLSNLSALILRHFARRGLKAIDETTSLVKSGLLDSFGILDLVLYLESEYRVRLQDRDVVPENFENLALIRRLLERAEPG